MLTVLLREWGQVEDVRVLGSGVALARLGCVEEGTRAVGELHNSWQAGGQIEVAFAQSQI